MINNIQPSTLKFAIDSSFCQKLNKITNVAVRIFKSVLIGGATLAQRAFSYVKIDLKWFLDRALYGTEKASSLKTLKKAGVLTAETWALIIQHQNPSSIDEHIKTLQIEGILTTENISAAIKNKSLMNLEVQIGLLKSEDLITAENVSAVLGYEGLTVRDTVRIASILVNLKRAGCLTPENRNLVIQKRDIYSLNDALEKIVIFNNSKLRKVNGKIKPENIAEILVHEDPQKIAFELIEKAYGETKKKR